ncbi:MAG TPA: AMP-binding protein [Solirubrobacteraceae bacterium]|nr:AMP-binding protein [Solirubrobacteraceae bacterium]
MLVEGWLARAAAARPAHAAVEAPAGIWTYGELLAHARAGASELAARGARAGERVAIALPGGLDFAQALHACLLLGAVAVPLDTRLSERERCHIADGAALLLEEPLRRASPAAAQAPLAAGHDLDAVAVVLHTSGTSARPRPVELTYGNFLWSALASAVALERDPRERWLCALPVAHVAGLSILLRSAIYATTAVVHERFETDRVLHALAGGEITLISLVATTLARLLEARLSKPPSLRCALTGGGPIPGPLRERARAAGVPVSLTYGLTEACSQVSTTPMELMRRAGPVPGPPLFCVRVRVDGSEAPHEEGEILISGPTVAPTALTSDGWLRTGDVGFLDPEGHLHVAGRRADTIITGGENVAPAEVEAVLESHPDVLEAAVIGRADADWGESVTAIVVPHPGRALSGAALRDHCARTLARYKVPREVVVSTDPLPRTRSGKLLRRALS